MGEVPVLDSALVMNEEDDTLTLFAVNRSLTEDVQLSCDLRQFEGYKVLENVVLDHADLKAVNTEAAPHTVAPVTGSGAVIEDGKLTAVFNKHSWNMIRLGK